MTDKEQIMINGIDISGCEYACNTAFGKKGCKHPMMKNIYCSENPNCYFKQLTRKIQEYEELQVAYNKAQDILGRIDRANELKSYNLKKKNKECRELKQQLDLYKTWYRAKHNDVKDTLARYRKALKEIEEYCDMQISLTGDLPFRTTESDILDIINKVKGDLNEE